YAATVAGQLLGFHGKWLRFLWTAGCALFLVHVAAAFHYVHNWSHQAAVQTTATETQQLLGIAFGEGLWFSYAFVLLWLLDTLWWWISDTTWQRRPRALNFALHGYLLFIAFNGAVVFEAGPTRLVGLLVTPLLLFLMFRRLR
ncbi:MAG: hypothetical protein ACKON9_25095, partial [Planctomycetaceae bacterium]